jgi:hypothetical protein
MLSSMGAITDDEMTRALVHIGFLEDAAVRPARDRGGLAPDATRERGRAAGRAPPTGHGVAARAAAAAAVVPGAKRKEAPADADRDDARRKRAGTAGSSAAPLGATAAVIPCPNFLWLEGCARSARPLARFPPADSRAPRAPLASQLTPPPTRAVSVRRRACCAATAGRARPATASPARGC